MITTSYQVGATLFYLLTDEHAKAERGWGAYTRSHNNKWLAEAQSLVSPLSLCACPFPCSDRLPLAFSPSVLYPSFKFWLKICTIKEPVVNEHHPLAGSTSHYFNLYVLGKQLNIALVKSDRRGSDTQPSSTNCITLGKLLNETTPGIIFIGSHLLNFTFLAWLSCSWY